MLLDAFAKVEQANQRMCNQLRPTLFKDKSTTQIDPVTIGGLSQLNEEDL